MMTDLDQTKVANAYMRTLEDMIKNLTVSAALLEAKLQVSTATLAVKLDPADCASGCKRPENCECIKF